MESETIWTFSPLSEIEVSCRVPEVALNAGGIYLLFVAQKVSLHTFVSRSHGLLSAGRASNGSHSGDSGAASRRLNDLQAFDRSYFRKV